MVRRFLLCVALLVAIALLAGCGGPSKEGLKQRQLARDRMNVLNAQIHFDQARQAFEVGQFDKAMREINAAIALYPASADYHLLQGRIHLETKRLEQAINCFNTALEKKADLADAHYFAGIVFQRWSDDEQAFEHYSQAFAIDSSRVEYLLASAESLVSLGRFDDAKTLIADKLAYFEHNAALRQLQGQIALLQGDPKQAAKLYGEARLLNPDDSALVEDLMWAQYAAGEYGQCLESIRMIQGRLAQPRTDLTHLQARCMTALGRSKEARDLYMELTRSAPSDPSVWVELGTLAWELGDYRRVAQCSVQIIALAPHRYEGYMLKGINERQKGNVEVAVSLFQEACQHTSDVALPHMLLGQTLEQAGDLNAAMEAYQSAVDADPGNSNARTLLRRTQTALRISAAPGQ